MRRLIGSPLRIGILVLAIALVIVTAVVFFPRHRAPALTDRDSIVLADFQNATDDSSLDLALKQALAGQLSQSPYLSIFPESRIRDRANGTLVLMQRQPTDALTPAVALEVCQREGIKAVLGGSIASVGSTFSLALTATNCATGEQIASESVSVTRKEDVLDALGRMSSAMRSKLGESLASIQKHEAPIRATTSNFEALSLLGQALAFRDSGQEPRAIPLVERAVQLDPNFAQAWARLGAMYKNQARTTADLERALAARTRAFALRDRVTGPERYYIEGSYYQGVTEDLDAAVKTFELWKSTYPRDAIPHNYLALIAAAAGDYEKAVVEAREAVRLEPLAVHLGNLALWLQYTGRLDEAEQTIQRAFAHKIETVNMHLRLHTIAFLRGDAVAMQRELDWLRGKAERQYYGRQAAVAAYAGRLREAANLQERIDAINERERMPEPIANARANRAIDAALVGDHKAALTLADSAISVPSAWGPCLFAYAIVGDQARMDRLWPGMLTQLPAGYSKLDGEPVDGLFKGAMLLKRGKPDEALQHLRTAARYEGAVRYGGAPQYLRGYALIAAKRPAEAAAEFQKILALRALDPFGLVLPAAQVGLARAYSAMGDKAASRKAYEDLFALWKDADPDIPILVEARKEYATLK